MTGGGRFGPGRLDGERAEEAAALRRPGVSWRLGETSGTRVRVMRCQEAARWRWGTSRVHLAAGARWTKSTGGVRRAAGETEPAGREMEIGAFLRFLKIPGTSR